MEGLHWHIRNEDQRANFLAKAREWPLPFMAKLAAPHHPKTLKQIRYMHSLCNALAAHHHASPDVAKRDAKAAFGVVIVSTSLVTGERSARLKSFSAYTKEEAEAFCTAMEVYLAENAIPFTPSE